MRYLLSAGLILFCIVQLKAQALPVHSQTVSDRKDVEQLDDEIGKPAAITLINRIGFDEVATMAAIDRQDDLNTELRSMSMLCMVLIDHMLKSVQKARNGEYGPDKVKELTREIVEFRKTSDSDLRKLLKEKIGNKNFDVVVNGMIRAAGPDYFECDLIADELELGIDQVQKLRNLRKQEIALLRKIDLDGKPDPRKDILAPIRKDLSNVSVKVIDTLTKDQFNRIWIAKGILQSGQGIEDFLAKQKSRPDFKEFVKKSELLTTSWNETFPNEKIER